MVRDAPPMGGRPAARPLAGAALLAALAWPALARANGGTPLLWVTSLHLTIGNLFVGLGEAWVLRRFFGAKGAGVIPLLVLANYASMIAGFAFIGACSDAVWAAAGGLAGVDLYLAAMTALTFALTLAVEWPFCLAALGPRPRRLRDSVTGTLVTQGASYAVLIAIYLSLSVDSPLGGLTVDRGLARSLPAGAAILFIGDDGGLWRIAAGTAAPERLETLDPHCREGELLARKTDRGFEVCWRGRAVDVEVPVLTLPAPEWRFDTAEKDAWRSRDLRSEAERDWEFLAFRIGWSGWSASRRSAGEELRGVLHTPFRSLSAADATILPGDLVVVELGGEIAAIDLNGRRIAPLARGRGPVVGLRAAAGPAGGGAKGTAP